MTHILIIEDEAVAAQHLQRTTLELLPDADILGTLQSIEETVEYFSSDGAAQLGCLPFLDIHLADGLAFRIFDLVSIPCPIVFTTAYDQYALDAFRAGSLDYLLKPISKDDLAHAFDKLRRLGLLGHKTAQHTPVPHNPQKNYRSHFLIPVRDKLIPVEVSKIACFYLQDKVSHAILADGHRQAIDKPLDAIFDQLNPQHFFRANRQYIVAHNAIQDITLWPIGKLALSLCVPTPDRIIVSKAKVNEFKQWYTK